MHDSELKKVEALEPVHREIGKILYDLFEAYFESMPRIKKWLARRMFSSKILLKRYSQHAKKSQLRTYPDDWVWESA